MKINVKNIIQNSSSQISKSILFNLKPNVILGDHAHENLPLVTYSWRYFSTYIIQKIDHGQSVEDMMINLNIRFQNFTRSNQISTILSSLLIFWSLFHAFVNSVKSILVDMYYICACENVQSNDSIYVRTLTLMFIYFSDLCLCIFIILPTILLKQC